MSKFLSLCITSYNRPAQLRRCLESVDTKYINEVEILIGDDCSPLRNEISKSVIDYRAKSTIKTILINNPTNIGYDANFHNIISAATGTYLLFVTDDDALLPGSVDKIIDILKQQSFPVAFTPFFNRESNKLSRNYYNSYEIPPSIDSAVKFFYDSILLSGLIFRRDRIPSYDPRLFKGLIYSQVFVFICILYEHGGGYVNIPTIDYIGDGVNGFGSNAGEERNELLTDRLNYLSNLEYNKRLAEVTKLFDNRFNTNIHASISRVYSIRTITGFCYARSFGINALKEYRKSLYEVGFNLGVLPNLYYYSLRIFGLTFIRMTLDISKSMYLKIQRLIAILGLS